MPAHRAIDPLISLSIRIKKSVLDVLKAKAVEANVTLADLFRSHLMVRAVKPLGVPVKRHRDGDPLKPSRPCDPALVLNLGAIGSNLNQLARAVNTGAIAGSLIQSIEVLMVLRSIECQISALIALNKGSSDAH